MLISFKSRLDNLHISESELRTMLQIRSDPYQIRLRRKAQATQIQVTAASINFDVPVNELWIVWGASIVNNTVACEPIVIQYLDGYKTGPGYKQTFHWPTVSVGKGPTGAGAWGSIIDPVWWPQILWGGQRINITDEAWAAGHVVTFNMFYTIVSEDDYL